MQPAIEPSHQTPGLRDPFLGGIHSSLFGQGSPGHWEAERERRLESLLGKGPEGLFCIDSPTRKTG